jgi:PAS domain S-box-containing protein
VETCTEPKLRVEGIVLFGCLIAVSLGVFLLRTGGETVTLLPYSTFPFVIWAGLRFATKGAITAVFVIAVLAVLGTAQELGPFAKDGSFANLPQLHGFLSILAIVGLFLAAALAERRQIECALKDARDELELRVAARAGELDKRNTDLRDEIAEHKQALEELERQNVLFEAVFRDVPDAMILANSERKIIMSNPAFTRTFGYDPDEVLGTRTQVLYESPEEFERQGSMRFNTTAEQKPETYVVSYRRKNGDVFPGETTGTAIHDRNGSVLGFLGVMRDITERQHMEQYFVQSQKMEAIGQLTGGIAHDFNNMLMVIDGYSRRAIRQLDDGQSSEAALKEVLVATDRAAKLTKQLLSFSRQQVVEKQVFRVDDAVMEIKGLLQRSVGELYDLSFQLDDGGACVETDAGELGQAIMNLAVNARDAMPDGGPIVIGARLAEVGERQAARHQDMEPGRFVELFMTDRGQGIPEATLQRIFEPFYTTKTKGKGTGLGLAMVYGFARQSGGGVEVDSAPGYGTSFRIYLPVVDRESQAAPAEAKRDYHGRGETILLVEDDAPLLTLTQGILEDLGYKVLTAADGLEALEVDEDHDAPIDLLLSDVVMPALGGFETAKLIRERRPEIKIVFMSGYPNRGCQENKIPDQAKFLQKPVKAARLAQILREELENDALRLVG